jgi:hypothetical protein
VAVILGSVVLDGFEVSDAVHFGGKQALAVHRLPGGGRIIDALGPDDADITWSGILTGGNAAGRARLLDGLRRNGSAVTLAWDSFLIAVIVGELLLDFANPWWIPYRIRCVVAPGVTELAAGATSTTQSAVLTDLGTAAGFINIGAAASSLAPADAFTQGTADYAQASIALSALVSTTDTAIVATGGGLAAGTTISDLLTSTGSLANLAAARGYLGRANANFLLAGS